MMNNITQVSPGNRVDFSRIRKAKFGTQIHKFLGGGIPLWYLNLYSNNSALTGWNKNKNSSFAGATIYGTGGSSLHGNAGDLDYAYRSNAAYTGNHDLIGGDIQYWYDLWAKENPTATPEQMVQAYNTIADRIRQYQTQGHSYGDTGARTNNKDFINLFHSRSFKEGTEDKSNDMSFIGYQENLDDIYGSSSFLRRMDRYEKEYENLSDAEKAARTFNIKMGDKDVQVYKKANGDIALLPSTASDSDESTITDNNAASTTVNATPGNNSPAKPYTPTEYDSAEGEGTGKFRFPTFPLYNAALLGVANATNKRILDTKLKAPSMRYTFTPRVATLERPYVELQQNEQKLQEYKWDIQQLLDNTNDLGKSQDAYRDVRGKELDTLMQNNLRQSDIYRQSKENVTNTVNYNKAGWDQNANQNRQAWVAEARDRLNAIAQYQAQRGLNLQENIMSNYTDWKSWNRNNQLQDYADWRNTELAKVQQDMNTAYENYLNSGDISKYLGYKDFWSGLVDENGNIIDDKGFGTAYARYLTDNHIEDSEKSRLKFFKDNYQNEKYKNQLGDFIEGWNNYQSDAMNQYMNDSRAIQTRWGLLDARGKPINFDGEVSSWLYNKMNPRGSYKSIYSMARGGRFLEYLRHNRRAEKEIRDTTMKSMQDSRKLLARDLDALDKESLLLLRAIFK